MVLAILDQQHTEMQRQHGRLVMVQGETPLVVDAERLNDLLAAARGPALQHHLHMLSPTERRLFDWLYYSRPYFIQHEFTVPVLFGTGYEQRAARHNLRVVLTRLRQRLRPYGWRVESSVGTGALRLVHCDDQGAW